MVATGFAVVALLFVVVAGWIVNHIVLHFMGALIMGALTRMIAMAIMSVVIGIGPVMSFVMTTIIATMLIAMALTIFPIPSIVFTVVLNGNGSQSTHRQAH